MKRIKSNLWKLFLLVLVVNLLPQLVLAGGNDREVDYIINIDTDEFRHEIPETLYGLFYEDINYAADGGLYAELVKNRSFEYDDNLDGWSDKNRGDAKLSIESIHPLNENNPNYLKIDLNEGSEIKMSNSGYDGIAVKEGESYRLSVYLRKSADFHGTIAFSLESRNSVVFAESEIKELSNEWEKHTLYWEIEDSYSEGDLHIRVKGEGKVYLDMVSLFPENTWQERENGLRKDLVEKLQALEPGFLRFPGGCIVEGDKLENAYSWKDSIGDIAERPINRNLWGYYQSYGLGFHEYFQLAQDLGAEPVPVVNAGISCQVRGAEFVHMHDLDSWIQDALDLIEYANGSVDTEWGAKRAANGNTKPFDLKYLAVGNENWGPEYYHRYEAFAEAIYEQYPDIELITTSGVHPDDYEYEQAWEWARDIDADIVDEHMYRPPEWFLTNSSRYDKYERPSPKVFVGEFAAHTGERENNMKAALAEAAFMTGLERNSDIVVMSSYAPLFNKAGSSQWTPDLIWFDNTAVFGTPSYYVQKLFSSNLGDYVLDSSLEELSGEERGMQRNSIQGKVGLASWRTKIEVDYFKVTDQQGKVIFDDQFNGASGDWEIYSGDWEFSDGSLFQRGIGEDYRIYTGRENWTDYTIETKVRKIDGDEGILIPFAVEDNNNFYWWNIGGWNNTITGIEKAVDGSKMMLGDSVRLGMDTGRWYTVKIEVKGREIKCYLNDELIHETTDDLYQKPLYYVSSFDKENNEIIVKVVNNTAKNKDIALNLVGSKEMRGNVSLYTLESKGDLSAVNSFENPMNVYPEESQFDNANNSSIFTLPPYSLTVLSLGVN